MRRKTILKFGVDVDKKTMANVQDTLSNQTGVHSVTSSLECEH